MKFSHSRSKSLVALGLLSTSSIVSAFPLIKSPFASSEVAEVQQEVKRAPQGYSVIPVDGGSATAAGPTLTVTDAIIQTSTILSTVTAVPTNLGIPDVPAAVTVASPSQPGVTSLPYDNGMWHTTYYYQTTITPTAVQGNVAATATFSTAITPTVSDPGQWAYWAAKFGTGSP